MQKWYFSNLPFLPISSWGTSKTQILGLLHYLHYSTPPPFFCLFGKASHVSQLLLTECCNQSWHQVFFTRRRTHRAAVKPAAFGQLVGQQQTQRFASTALVYSVWLARSNSKLWCYCYCCWATVRGEHCKSSMQQTYVCTITFRMWKKTSSNRESNPTTRTQLLTFQKIEMANNGLHIIF